VIDLRSPYPWWGGKLMVAPIVWRRFGNVRNYIEPFYGSGAVLLNRPQPFQGPETVNDLNGWLCNFWRALQADPEAVASYADWPVSELDLHARGDWLFYRKGVAEFVERLRSDPVYFDVKSAGWWVWGQCCWIGTGWGPKENRKRPHLGDAGRGVDRQLPHLGSAGSGVNRKLPHLGSAGRGEEERGHGREPQATAKGFALREYLYGLAERMRQVRVCCGDWRRVCGPTPTVQQGLTAVFLDPPYGVDDRADCYDGQEDYEVSKAVREWAIEHGDDKRMRIALCGYDGEHVMPPTWECYAWKARGGYGSQAADGENENAERERIWFSPHCLGVKGPVQADLFVESAT
jgi:site-specific DNA-adenine methylase